MRDVPETPRNLLAFNEQYRRADLEFDRTGVWEMKPLPVGWAETAKKDQV